MTRFPSIPGALTSALASALCLATSPAWGDVAAHNFSVATTADLIALCDVDADDPASVEATQFCRGFAVGAYQYYLALAAASPADRYVCFPDPPPSRDTVRAAFVAWAEANPAEMSKTPVDSLFRYLAETYPCSAAARAGQ